MALIGQIRKNSWILILLLGLALGGFILMDIVSNSSRYSSSDQFTVGKVNGKTIDWNSFQSYEKLVYANSTGDPYQRRRQIWDYYVEDAIVDDEAKKLGLGVPKEELLDLEFGTNLSPIIRQRFSDPNGQVAMAQLNSIKSAIESNQLIPEYRQYWAVQEKEIIKDRLQSKLINMVSKGLYAPSWMAEMAFTENNQRIDFKYVKVPYDKVADTDIKLEDSDYAAYLKENKGMFFQTEETRTVDFVTFDVKPTGQDSTTARTNAQDIATRFRTATGDSAFVVSNQGTWDGSYKKKAELPPMIADTLLRLPVGTIIGPYLEGENYTVAKILDRKVIADSVRARHILQKADNAQALAASEKKIDSLLMLINTGKARFDSLAMRFGQDGTASKGGDLGFFGAGTMVKEFNDLCFYKGEPGKVYKVKTQFGWHLVEITSKKFIKNETGVKFASLTQRIVPSDNTQQIAKDRAIQLANKAKTVDDLKKEAEAMGLKVETSAAVKENDYFFGALGSGESPRDIIRWAFNKDTKKGVVDKEVFTFRDDKGGYFDNKYVVTALKNILPKGDATVEGVKSTIETQVKNRKKAQLLMSKIQGNDLGAIAGQFSATVDTAKNVSFLSASVGNTAEPKVVGKAFRLANGSTAGPIEGVSGVYVIQAITDKPAVQLPPDLTPFRKQAVSSIQAQVRSRLMASMKKNAEIKDNRSRFF